MQKKMLSAWRRDTTEYIIPLHNNAACGYDCAGTNGSYFCNEFLLCRRLFCSWLKFFFSGSSSDWIFAHFYIALKGRKEFLRFMFSLNSAPGNWTLCRDFCILHWWIYAKCRSILVCKISPFWGFDKGGKWNSLIRANCMLHNGYLCLLTTPVY